MLLINRHKIKGEKLDTKAKINLAFTKYANYNNDSKMLKKGRQKQRTNYALFP